MVTLSHVKVKIHLECGIETGILWLHKTRPKCIQIRKIINAFAHGCHAFFGLVAIKCVNVNLMKNPSDFAKKKQ